MRSQIDAVLSCHCSAEEIDPCACHASLAMMAPRDRRWPCHVGQLRKRGLDQYFTVGTSHFIPERHAD